MDENLNYRVDPEQKLMLVDCDILCVYFKRLSFIVAIDM